MEDLYQSIWAQLGGIGLLVVVLIIIVIRMDRRLIQREISHAKERKEWRLQADRQHSEAIEIIRHSMAILNEIKGMIRKV